MALIYIWQADRMHYSGSPLFACWVILHAFCCLLIPDVLSGLILFQTVCKIYQQMALEGKELRSLTYSGDLIDTEAQELKLKELIEVCVFYSLKIPSAASQICKWKFPKIHFILEILV